MAQNQRYDLIIVGAGMAGCILAARIAENGVNPRNGEPLKIALLDWGPYLKGTPRPGYGHPARRQAFTNVMSDFREGDRYRTQWGKAKVVGGSGLHYGAQAFHPFDVDYLHWQNETGVDWTQENFKEAVEEVRTMFNVHPVPKELLTVGQFLFEGAATKLGHKLERTSHARKNCIYCGLGCRDSQMSKYDSKMNSFVAHLPIAEEHGVEIIPNTRVEKVILEKKGTDFVATGVWAEQSTTGQLRLTADKVLLCACENGTPLILYNSGYGPRDLLGKDLVVENSNVGRHLDGKLRVGSFPAYFPVPIKDPSRGMPSAFYFFHGGSADGYHRTLFKDGTSNLEWPERVALHEFAPEFGREHKRFMATGGGHIASQVSIQYKRRECLEGFIHRDGSHEYPASVTLDAKPARDLKESMIVLRDIYREMGSVKIRDIDPVLKELDAVAASSFQGRSPVGATHQSCSCRAGADRSNSVVNERFECHDIRNLLICDLSVLPRVTYGNPGVAMVAHVACFAWRRLVQDHFS